MKSKKISVVVSVYNEELSLKKFYEVCGCVLESCKWDYELIFVNDGSIDNSLNILNDIAIKNPKVKIINFSRNFGHEAAMIAGIDHCSGDGIVCMDSDLQHPPEIIPEIIDKLENGYEVISMVRNSREDSGIIKKITSSMFYKILNLLSPIKFEKNSSDFFAVSKNIGEILRKDYREKIRYLRGYVQSLGFKKTTIEFDAKSRIAGKSKYNIYKLIKFSVATLCSFSDIPLKMGIYSGGFVALCGFILMIYSIINKFVYDVPSGYSTIIVVMCFMFAILLFVIGIIGQYISILFSEVKGRPIYIVKELKNFEE